MIGGSPLCKTFDSCTQPSGCHGPQSDIRCRTMEGSQRVEALCEEDYTRIERYVRFKPPSESRISPVR